MVFPLVDGKCKCEWFRCFQWLGCTWPDIVWLLSLSSWWARIVDDSDQVRGGSELACAQCSCSRVDDKLKWLFVCICAEVTSSWLCAPRVCGVIGARTIALGVPHSVVMMQWRVTFGGQLGVRVLRCNCDEFTVLKLYRSSRSNKVKNRYKIK